MTNATKTLSILFAGLLVITVLTRLIGASSSSQAFRTDIVKVDTAKVNKIVIDDPVQNRAITLSKEAAGQWNVSDNLLKTSYPADANRIKRAVEQLNSLEVKSVATRDPQKYTRYKADSTGTKVLLYNGDTQLAGLIVGAPEILSRSEFNSYVRPVDAKAVYAVNGFLSSSFNTDISHWRDKKVWELPRQNINTIDFLLPADSSFSIKKAGDKAWVSAGDTLSSMAVSNILSKFSPLQASGFADSLKADDFGTGLYAIQLHMDNGEQKTLRLKPFKNNDGSFLAVASGYPYVFTLNKSSWKNTVLKPRSKMLKNPKSD